MAIFISVKRNCDEAWNEDHLKGGLWRIQNGNQLPHSLVSFIISGERVPKRFSSQRTQNNPKKSFFEKIMEKKSVKYNFQRKSITSHLRWNHMIHIFVEGVWHPIDMIGLNFRAQKLKKNPYFWTFVIPNRSKRFKL